MILCKINNLEYVALHLQEALGSQPYRITALVKTNSPLLSPLDLARSILKILSLWRGEAISASNLS